MQHLIGRHFNEEELRGLVAALDLEYSDLAGETRLAKIRELVDYCERRGLESELVRTCRRERPNVKTWPAI